MSSALKSQELAEELVDPKAFGKSGEAWVFAQVATIALYLVPWITRSDRGGGYYQDHRQRWLRGPGSV